MSMRKTPKEIAAKEYYGQQQMEWLAGATPREIFEFLQNTALFPHDPMFQQARVALEVRIAEDAMKTAAENLEAAKDILSSAGKTERQTNKLIWLTWAIVGLTVALLVFAGIQTVVMLNQNAGTDTQHIQTGQNQTNISSNQPVSH